MTMKFLTARHLITGAVILTAGLGTAGVASAATASTPATTTVTTHVSAKSTTPPWGGPGGPGGSGDPATMPLGPGQTLLTGSTLTSADAAASAAVTDATVVRSLTGPSGTYLVIMKKSDGTYVTVVENSSFVVTSTDDGFGPGPRGGHGQGDPATLTHGPGETLLTGATLTSAVAAAEAAVPGATVVRAETDAQGATYEVHMKKTDGTYVTVKENANFTVTSTETGFGTPPAGARGGGAAGMPRP